MKLKNTISVENAKMDEGFYKLQMNYLDEHCYPTQNINPKKYIYIYIR